MDPVDIVTVPRLGAPEFEVLLYEFKDGINRYLAGRGATTKYRTLAELIEFNNANADREMPWFGQETFELAEKKGPLSEPAYRRALADCRRPSRAEGMDATLRRHRLDAIVCPTGGPAWTTDLVNGDHWNTAGDSSTPAAVAGYPHITVPAGFVDGLPVGLSFMGPAWSEGRLLRYAFAFERATNYARRAPQLQADPRLIADRFQPGTSTRSSSKIFRATRYPGTPLTAPPRSAEEPHRYTPRMSVSTPQVPSSSGSSVKNQLSELWKMFPRSRSSSFSRSCGRLDLDAEPALGCRGRGSPRTALP